MINMWIKVAIGEACGLPVVLSTMKYHFLPIWLSIPLGVVASFACVYSLRDANNKLKENLAKFELQNDEAVN